MKTSGLEPRADPGLATDTAPFPVYIILSYLPLGVIPFLQIKSEAVPLYHCYPSVPRSEALSRCLKEPLKPPLFLYPNLSLSLLPTSVPYLSLTISINNWTHIILQMVLLTFSLVLHHLDRHGRAPSRAVHRLMQVAEGADALGHQNLVQVSSLVNLQDKQRLTDSAKRKAKLPCSVKADSRQTNAHLYLPSICTSSKDQARRT